jgi:hypothetical protein
LRLGFEGISPASGFGGPPNECRREAAAPGTHALAIEVSAMTLPPAQMFRAAPRARPVRPARSSAGSALTGVRRRQYARPAPARAHLPGRCCGRAGRSLPRTPKRGSVPPAPAPDRRRRQRTTLVTTRRSRRPVSVFHCQPRVGQQTQAECHAPARGSINRTFTSTDWL